MKFEVVPEQGILPGIFISIVGVKKKKKIKKWSRFRTKILKRVCVSCFASGFDSWNWLSCPCAAVYGGEDADYNGTSRWEGLLKPSIICSVLVEKWILDPLPIPQHSFTCSMCHFNLIISHMNCFCVAVDRHVNRGRGGRVPHWHLCALPLPQIQVIE